MKKTALIMAAGSGGHIFSSGRAVRLTCYRKLACTENVPPSFVVGGAL